MRVCVLYVCVRVCVCACVRVIQCVRVIHTHTHAYIHISAVVAAPVWVLCRGLCTCVPCLVRVFVLGRVGFVGVFPAASWGSSACVPECVSCVFRGLCARVLLWLTCFLTFFCLFFKRVLNLSFVCLVSPGGETFFFFGDLH